MGTGMLGLALKWAHSKLNGEMQIVSFDTLND